MVAVGGVAYGWLMNGRGTMEPLVALRRDQIIRSQVARETPWVMLVLAALIVFFDSASALAGLTTTVGYYVSDLIQGVFFLASAYVVRRRLVPVHWAPWVFSAAIVTNIAALSYQHSVDPAGNAIGVILMTMVLFGGLLAMWRPFFVSSIIVVSIVSGMLIAHDPGSAAPWIIATVTGVGASAALLFARRRSAQELAVATLAIERSAQQDPATGLLNRAGLASAAERLVAVSRRLQEPLFAVFIDVDGLKTVNDRYGHTHGDAVIRACADAVRRASRDADLVARWGGDEFVVVGLGPQPLLADYRARVQGCMDLRELDGLWSGEVSVGTASNVDGDIEAVIHAADDAMYASRRDPSD